MVIRFTKQVVLAALMAAALAACASPKYVVSDVTRHHSLPRSPSGETFAVLPSQDDQDESLAFAAYASIIERQLSGLGLRPFSGQQSSPDLVVTLKWSVEGPSPDVRSSGTGWGTSFGYGSRYSHWGIGYGYPYDNRTKTRQMFIRRVELAIYDGATYNTENPQRVFEGSAVSQGTNGQIDPVMPYIIQAIFDQFPGASGATRTVRVEVPPESAAVQTSQYSGRSSK